MCSCGFIKGIKFSVWLEEDRRSVSSALTLFFDLQLLLLKTAEASVRHCFANIQA